MSVVTTQILRDYNCNSVNKIIEIQKKLAQNIGNCYNLLSLQYIALPLIVNLELEQRKFEKSVFRH